MLTLFMHSKIKNIINAVANNFFIKEHRSYKVIYDTNDR